MRFRYFSLVAIAMISSCSQENLDLTPPTFDVASYTPIPSENEICGSNEPVVFLLSGGEELSFNAVFNDNEALSQYKVDIHNNFDCHGHGGGSAPSVPVLDLDNLTVDWTILEIQNISGSSVPVERVFKVPENVTAGNYHFHVQVIDESGNDSPLANFHSLKVKNPTDDIPPQISIIEPTSNKFTVKKGESIHFEGQLTDNKSLTDGGNGVLYLAYTDLSSGNTFSTDKAFSFDETVTTSYNFDFDFIVPQTLVSGNYRFSLGANDGVRNVAEFIFFEVEITN